MNSWLSERRRSLVCLLISVSVAVVLPLDSVVRISASDVGVLVLFALRSVIGGR